MIILKADDKALSLREAVVAVRSGGIVACPTETFYGLCARYDDEAVLERLYALKGSPRGEKPFPLIIGSEEALPLVAVEVNEASRRLMKRFWPGPLTLILKAKEGLSGYISAEGKVAVRVPGESFALLLARQSGLALTATSANPSGRPPAKSAQEAAEYFAGGGVDILIEGGRSPGQLASTIVEATEGGVELLREGAIGFDEVKKALGN